MDSRSPAPAHTPPTRTGKKSKSTLPLRFLGPLPLLRCFPLPLCFRIRSLPRGEQPPRTRRKVKVKESRIRVLACGIKQRRSGAHATFHQRTANHATANVSCAAQGIGWSLRRRESKLSIVAKSHTALLFGFSAPLVLDPPFSDIAFSSPESMQGSRIPLHRRQLWMSEHAKAVLALPPVHASDPQASTEDPNPARQLSRSKLMSTGCSSGGQGLRCCFPCSKMSAGFRPMQLHPSSDKFASCLSVRSMTRSIEGGPLLSDGFGSVCGPSRTAPSCKACYSAFALRRLRSRRTCLQRARCGGTLSPRTCRSHVPWKRGCDL